MPPNFRCNTCWRAIQRGAGAAFTSCGHVICSACQTFKPGEETICPICRSKCGTILLPSNPGKLPSSIRSFFQDPAHLLKQVAEVLRFQASHDLGYQGHVRARLQELQSATQECSRLQLELAKANETIQRLRAERDQLRRRANADAAPAPASARFGESLLHKGLTFSNSPSIGRINTPLLGSARAHQVMAARRRRKARAAGTNAANSPLFAITKYRASDTVRRSASRNAPSMSASAPYPSGERPRFEMLAGARLR